MLHPIRPRPFSLMLLIVVTMLSPFMLSVPSSPASAKSTDATSSLPAVSDPSASAEETEPAAQAIVSKSQVLARIAKAKRQAAHAAHRKAVALRKARVAARRKARAAEHREWAHAPAYKVRPGDTLSEIVVGFGTTDWRQTAKSPWNHIRNPHWIEIGQKLHILGAKHRRYVDPTPTPAPAPNRGTSKTTYRLSPTPTSTVAGTGTCTDDGTSVSYHYGSERLHRVIRYACAQTAKPYVWGAAGPRGFDCSGLTMMAYAQAGVSLPHHAASQFSKGQPVSESDLRPGDLVFYYSGIQHVGMYIGDGYIVNAANPSSGINIYPLHAMPYVGARRYITTPAPALTVQNASATTSVSTKEMTHQQMAARAGWHDSDFSDLNTLIMRESGWDPHANNPISSAYGIPQALPGSKMASAGADWQTNPVTQLRWMRSYVLARYGSIQNALAHSSRFGWY
jgi:cell wall-associated NlpC family hydrolase